jgi:hypothetical protein
MIEFNGILAVFWLESLQLDPHADIRPAIRPNNPFTSPLLFRQCGSVLIYLSLICDKIELPIDSIDAFT